MLAAAKWTRILSLRSSRSPFVFFCLSSFFFPGLYFISFFLPSLTIFFRLFLDKSQQKKPMREERQWQRDLIGLACPRWSIRSRRRRRRHRRRRRLAIDRCNTHISQSMATGHCRKQRADVVVDCTHKRSRFRQLASPSCRCQTSPRRSFTPTSSFQRSTPHHHHNRGCHL